MSSNIVSLISNYKVSSVLNKNNKEFGKQFLLDGSDETCWNSHQGKPQYIYLEFKEPVQINKVHLVFQGGFAGKDGQFLVASGGGDAEVSFHSDFYPDDISTEQIFDLGAKCSKLKIVFNDSADFYGRVTIYKLDFS